MALYRFKWINDNPLDIKWKTCVVQVLSARVEQIDAIRPDASVRHVVRTIVDDCCILADSWDCAETDAAVEVVRAVTDVRCTYVNYVCWGSVVWSLTPAVYRADDTRWDRMFRQSPQNSICTTHDRFRWDNSLRRPKVACRTCVVRNTRPSSQKW